ncbi:unnamed protein product [Caretta caretta]
MVIMAGDKVSGNPQAAPTAPPPPAHPPLSPVAPTSTAIAKPPATTPSGALAAAGTRVDSTAATSLAPSDSVVGGSPQLVGKARGKRVRAPPKRQGPPWWGLPPLPQPRHRLRHPSPLLSPPALQVPLSQPPGCTPRWRRHPRPPTPAAMSPLLATASTSISGGRGPFPTLTRKHGVCCLLVPASSHVETYVRALMRVVGPTAIVAASKMYGKVVFFLASKAAVQEAVEKGLAVEGVFIPLQDLGILLVLTSVPLFLPNAALLPTLSTLGKPISVVSPLPLGYKDPALRHILSFCRHVQLQLPLAVRDREALKGSFLVPY